MKDRVQRGDKFAIEPIQFAMLALPDKRVLPEGADLRASSRALVTSGSRL